MGLKYWNYWIKILIPNQWLLTVSTYRPEVKQQQEEEEEEGHHHAISRTSQSASSSSLTQSIVHTQPHIVTQYNSSCSDAGIKLRSIGAW